MKTDSGTLPSTQPRKQRLSPFLAPLLIVAFALALGLRWKHDQRILQREQNKDGAPQAALASKIAGQKPEEQLATLLQALQESDSRVRVTAVEKLATLRTPQAVDAVETAFQDSAATVRTAALEALPQMDPERGLRLELAALQDDDIALREEVAEHLSTASEHTALDRRALPSLIHALDDVSPAVPVMSMNTLRHITGKDWHAADSAATDARHKAVLQWKQWWAGTAPKETIPAEFQAIAPRYPNRTDPAPDFHLVDTAGKTADLASERGKVILLNFWGTWCPPCQQEIPDLIRLDAAYRDKGLEIIGAALSEENGVDGLRQRSAVRGIRYRQAIAPDEMLDAYGDIHEVPVSVLIDRQGRVCYRWEGPRDYATFAAAVERLMKK